MHRILFHPEPKKELRSRLRGDVIVYSAEPRINNKIEKIVAGV